MPSRRTRTAKVEQSVTTRSRTQKKTNVIEEVSGSTEKIMQPKRKRRSSDVKEKLEINIEQNDGKSSLDTEETFSKSIKKQRSRRRLNLDTGISVQSATQRKKKRDLRQSGRISKDRHSGNNSMTEFVTNDIFQSDISGSVNSNKKRKRKIDADAKASPITVTPKNTPPKLSLTPHRSKKTPKKSPISLGSPKTHSLAIPKLLKSPRKLSLISVSEENVENRIDDNDDRKSQRVIKDKFNNISISPKSLSKSSKDKRNKSSIHLKAIANRFSKSPKSKKSKLTKLKLSPSQVEKSLLKTASIANTTVMSDFDEDKNISAMKRRLLKRTRLKNILTASQVKDVLTEPVVLLEKLPLEILQNIIRHKTQSDTLTKFFINSFEKSISRTCRRSNESAKQDSSVKLKGSSMERSINTVSPRIKRNTSPQEKDRSFVSLISSTPQERKKLLTNTSLISNTSIASAANTSHNTSSRRRKSNVQLCSIMNNSKTIEDISQCSLLDVSQSHLSNAAKHNAIFDKDSVTMQENKTNDETYELEQPQTLNLRQMIKRRTSTGANFSLKEDVKKVKVHFADLTFDKSTRNSTNEPIKLRSCVSHNVSLPRNNIANSTSKLRKIETPKFSRNSWLATPIKTRSIGTALKTQLNRSQITPRNVASIEKKSAKKSSTKKVPNFGRIHEKMFAKSESLVDAKKRLERRHLTFTADKAFPKAEIKKDEKKPLPTDTKDGTHNRFGFKLRKTEATHLILKKQTVLPRQKQHETRMMLKGVRTNRRFELQMKNRNIKS